jgi:hypothetical protein
MDGGITWDGLTSGTDYKLRSVYFTDVNTGYALSYYGTIIKTIDGGATWNALSNGTSNLLYSVFFTNSNTGYAVGEGGTILKTTNGGVTIIEETKPLELKFSLYPNPANSKIIITNTGKLAKEIIISILSINGQPIMHEKFQNQNLMELDVSTFTKGIYLVKIETRTGIEVKKLVIH